MSNLTDIRTLQAETSTMLTRHGSQCVHGVDHAREVFQAQRNEAHELSLRCIAFDEEHGLATGDGPSPGVGLWLKACEVREVATRRLRELPSSS